MSVWEVRYDRMVFWASRAMAASPGCGSEPQRSSPPAVKSCRVRYWGKKSTTEKSVMAMSLDAAHARLYPYFQGLPLRGEIVTKYDTAAGMADAWIALSQYDAQRVPPIVR